MVSDGQTGIIVDSRDNSDGLIRAVEQLIADPAARQRLGKLAAPGRWASSVLRHFGATWRRPMALGSTSAGTIMKAFCVDADCHF